MTKRQSKTQQRETVGQTVYDNLHKQPDVVDTREISSDALNHYWDDLKSCVETIKNTIHKSSYIQFIFIRDKVLQGMIVHANPFIVEACPTPTYAQHVWFYNYTKDQLELVWMMPFKEHADYLRQNMLTLDDNQKTILKYVMDYDDGTLEKKARTLNNEDDVTANLVIRNNHGVEA